MRKRQKAVCTACPESDEWLVKGHAWQLGRERAYSWPLRPMEGVFRLHLPPWDYILIHKLTKPYFIRVTQPAILSWHGPRNPGATPRAALVVFG